MNRLIRLIALLSVCILSSVASATADTSTSGGKPTARIVSPVNNEVLDVPSGTIDIQSPSGVETELVVNGLVEDLGMAGRTMLDFEHGIDEHVWYGVSLRTGVNDLTLWTKTANGRELADRVRVHVRGEPRRLILDCKKAQIPADGRSTTVIHGAIVDADGIPSNVDTPVTINTSAGSFVEPDADPGIPGYQVKCGKGEFTVTLKSLGVAQTANVTASASGFSGTLTVDFVPDTSHSIAAGVLDVRIGSGGVDSLGDGRDVFPSLSDPRNGVSTHGSVFVKTPVHGWLLTGAYDSNRALDTNPSGRAGLAVDTQSTDQQYPVYGDGSSTEHIADSSDNLFLRLEKKHDYFLYGNFGTQEFAGPSQQLTGIMRQLHAFKANLQGGNTEVTGFYADDIQGFQRDTIAPDGTSGYYYLSQRPVVVGSEHVYLQTLMLSRPGDIVDTTPQTPGTDYEIDYDRGALLFHQPVLRTDSDAQGNVLVRQIVVTYEYYNQSGSAHAVGGRVRYGLSGLGPGASSIGLTYFDQSQGVRDFTLYGADTLLKIGRGGSLVGEFAHSRNVSELMPEVTGSAYRLDYQAPFRGSGMLHSFVQSATTGFSNDATVTFVPGQTRYGAQVTDPVGKDLKVTADVERDVNRGVAPTATPIVTGLGGTSPPPSVGPLVDNSMTTSSIGIEHQHGKTTESVSVTDIQRTDNSGPQAVSSSSTHLQTHFATQIAPKIDAVVDSNNSLGSADTILTDNTMVGVNWKAAPGLGIGLAQQFLTRGQFAGKSITSLVVDGEKKFDRNSTVDEQVAFQSDSGGVHVQTSTGAERHWSLAPGLTAKAYYEQVSGNLIGNTANGPQLPLPFAVGSGSAILGMGEGESHGVELDYKGRSGFTADGRYEVRGSTYGTNTVVAASMQGKIAPPLTALVDYKQAGSSNNGPNSIGAATNLRIGLAYRDPRSDVWNVLARYDYRVLPSTLPLTIIQGTGMAATGQTFAVEGIYAPSWRWEVFGKYAFRRSATMLAQDYTTRGLISLAQLRATCRFRYDMDLNVEGRWISQPTAGADSTSIAADVGYYFTPYLRLGVGYAFGRSSDIDFSGRRYVGGPYIGLTMRADELFDGFDSQPASTEKASGTK